MPEMELLRSGFVPRAVLLGASTPTRVEFEASPIKSRAACNAECANYRHFGLAERVSLAIDVALDLRFARIGCVNVGQAST